MGGMAPSSPRARTRRSTRKALAQTRSDKEREVKMASTAPGSRTPICSDRKGSLRPQAGEPHQKERTAGGGPRRGVRAAGHQGPRRHHPRRRGPQQHLGGAAVLSAWLGGNGAVAIFNLMEDAARQRSRGLSSGSGSRTAPSSPTDATSIGPGCTRKRRATSELAQLPAAAAFVQGAHRRWSGRVRASHLRSPFWTHCQS